MNLSETAFFVREQSKYRIRWFTPTREVDLVGHATLAAGAFVLIEADRAAERVEFVSSGGNLAVSRAIDGFAMQMPALPPKNCKPPKGLDAALGRWPENVLAAKHYLCVFARSEDVADLTPDMAAIASLDLPAVIVTAPGEGNCDFVSRFFAPANGVPEDPVSGVSHCCLTPYWSKRTGRSTLVGRQLSRRGGTITCTNLGDRVNLTGNAVIFLDGWISV